MSRMKKFMVFIVIAVLNTFFIISLFAFYNSMNNQNGLKAGKDKQLIEEQLLLIDRLVKSYDYDNALLVLEQVKLKSEEKEAHINEIHNLKNSLVKYEGEVPHIFTHSLIVYPSLAFDGDYKHEGYDLWMTTVYEFKLIIEELYRRGYVLYDIRDLIDKDENGKIIKKDIYLPQGKTPLILSIDDLCYYNYMKGDGFATKLVLDENGQVSTVVPDEFGNEQITRDGDVIPIIDDFVDKYPDFSYKGAKGIIAVTGYEGVLGYRITDVEGDELNKLQNELSFVVNRLKSTGWSFASHSYTHNNYFKDYSITIDELEYDCFRWDTLIKPFVGDTSIYISPFGIKFNNDDKRMRHIVEKYNFNQFCFVGGTVPAKYYDDNMVMGRYAIDGLSLRQNKKILSKFFDCDLVIDPKRLNTSNP